MITLPAANVTARKVPLLWVAGLAFQQCCFGHQRMHAEQVMGQDSNVIVFVNHRWMAISSCKAISAVNAEGKGADAKNMIL